MANGKSDYLEGKILDHIFGIASFTVPGTVYVGLHKGDPTDTGGSGSEVSGGSYARVAITNNATGWSRSVSTVTNDGVVTFPTPSADWATSGNEVTHVTIWDASTSGNLLFSGALSVPRIILNGDPVSIAAGQLQIVED